MTEPSPNIIYIFADDMGIGDLSCYNPNSAWQTPHLDRLASEGLRYDNGHSSSAVCTPSRYSVLTGRYAWRSRLKNGVVGGFTPALVEPGRMTIASYLKEEGYDTHCVGKWHLGLDWVRKGEEEWDVDYTQPFGGGPCDHGFDSWYGISASLDMPPYVYLKDNEVLEQPDHKDPGFKAKGRLGPNNWSFWREGMRAPDFNHVDVMPRCTAEACRIIRDEKENPFFIYYALPAPHTPTVPTPAFEGSTGTTPYGDFCAQVDAEVGDIMQALEETGQADNTILIFTSDNGCSPCADYAELATFGHNPSLIYRGHKADIYEGGHRIPYITRWPAGIKAGGITEQTVCLSDLIATVADILDVPLPDEAGEDSVSNLPIWKDATLEEPVREATVHHSINGSFSIRQGKWKLELCPGSGGWSYPRPGRDRMDDLPEFQLYDLEEDVRERFNVIEEYPEVVEPLKKLLLKYVDDGRSTPGVPQQNHPEFGNRFRGLEWAGDA